MARKRLGGPLPDYLDGGVMPPAPGPALPIAQVAGDAAAMAALAAVSEELASARATGRMVLALPLAAVVEDHLIRDRVAQDPEEMEALMQSIAARGQQTPVEVAEIGSDAGGAMRYGLISGARRMTALRTLQARTGEARFGTVLALLRRPEGGADPYVAMVEENEIRVGLSFYERARIVMRAVEAGVYDSEKKALQGLFATASFAKRSKIKSFIPIVAALDGVLRFPVRIPERLGLRLSKALEAPGFAARAQAALAAAAPATAEAEAAVLTALLGAGSAAPVAVADDSGPAPVAGNRASEGASETAGEKAGDLSCDLPGGLRMTVAGNRIVIEGPGVDTPLVDALRGWLDRRG
jgi:ParB family transcriptional regulator, chromosome partitioning protein